MENKRLLLIVNPCSGKAKMKTALLQVVQILSAGGYEITVYPTKARGDATEYIASLPAGRYGTIVVAGGDGTLNEAVTGLLRSGTDCRIGYIPSGTLNEWSSGLKISRNINKAAEDIINGSEVRLDLGKFSDRYFCYTASFGAFTAASYSAPQDIKNVLGQAAYFFEGIKMLGDIKPIHLAVECAERKFEGDFLFGAVSNSLSVGGIVKFKDTLVKLNDGEFEVVLIRNPANFIQFQSYIDAILKHDLNREGIEFFHTSELTFTGGADLAWTLDGEYAAGAESVTIKNLPHALRLVLPEHPLPHILSADEKKRQSDNTIGD